MGVFADMLEDQMSEERYPNLNEEEDIIIDVIREDHWRGVAEEVNDNDNMHAPKVVYLC